jgi:glycosyltransferase involved in cell wall biosynthesis
MEGSLEERGAGQNWQTTIIALEMAHDTKSPSLVIHADVSDLLVYLLSQNHVTGIQRVLLELIDASRQSDCSWGKSVRWCAVDFSSFELMRIDDNSLYALVDEIHNSSPNRSTIDELIANIHESWMPSAVEQGDIYLVLGAFWVTTYTSSILAAMQRNGLRTGLLVYDLIPITHPEFCDIWLARNFSRQMNRALQLVDFAFTISEHVKRELQHYLKAQALREIPIVAVPLGHSHVKRTGSPVIRTRLAVLSGRKFVLAVGTIEVRKNHTYLLHVWRRMLKEKRAEVPLLVIVGRVGWRVVDLMEQLKATDNLYGNIVMLHNTSDEELDWLYKNCEFTVFASFEEGWGLPVGESLANGKLPVASMTSSIPEVGGDLVKYFDPYNVNDGYKVITDLLDGPSSLDDATRRISRHFDPRLWSDVGKNLFSQTIALSTITPAEDCLGYVELKESALLTFGQEDSRDADWGLEASLACTEGWNAPESWGRWSSSPLSTISFKAQANCKYSILLEYRMVPWMADNTVALHALSKDRVVLPAALGSTDEDGIQYWLVKADVVSDDRGIVKIVLETVGTAAKGEERMLYLGVRRMMYYKPTDSSSVARASEALALLNGGPRSV